MLFDKKGKLFGKISIVDVLIVVIIIAVIGGLYYKFGQSGTVTAFTRPPDKVRVSFVSETLPKYIVDSIKVGDAAKDRVQDIAFGKVVDIKVGPDLEYEPNSEGKVTLSSRPDYCSVTIIVEGQGMDSSTGATFGGVEYYVNKPVETRFGKAFFYSKIMDIQKVKE